MTFHFSTFFFTFPNKNIFAPNSSFWPTKKIFTCADVYTSWIAFFSHIFLKLKYYLTTKTKLYVLVFFYGNDKDPIGQSLIPLSNLDDSSCNDNCNFFGSSHYFVNLWFKSINLCRFALGGMYFWYDFRLLYTTKLGRDFLHSTWGTRLIQIITSFILIFNCHSFIFCTKSYSVICLENVSLIYIFIWKLHLSKE